MTKSFFGSERTFDELSEAISSQDSLTRWAALLELGGRSEAWAKELIASCLDDPIDDVARTAHEELGISFTARRFASNKAHDLLPTRPRATFLESFEYKVSQLDWSIEPSPVAMELFLRRIALDSRHLVSANENPFPQADSFERVLQIVNLFSQGPQDTQGLVSELGIDERQVHYYLAAAKYLGLLVESEGKLTIPSELLKALTEVEINPLAFFFEVAKAVVSVPSIANTFLECSSQSPALDRRISVDALRNSDAGAALSESTLIRRSRTVYSWAWWVHRNLNVLQESWASNEFIRQAPLPNFERALATVQRLGERELECLCRNNTLFGPQGGKTLDDVGREYGVSRERVRQIEKDVRERVLADIERETNWDWKSDLVEFLKAHLTFDSASLISEISSGKLGEAISIILLSHLNCSQIGKTKRFWTINEGNLNAHLDELKAITPLPKDEWIETAYAFGLSPQFLFEEVELFSIVDGIVIDPKKRREQIVKYHLSQVGTSHEQDLAELCGELPSRAFSEALRRNGNFRKNHLSGHWQLVESLGKQAESSFSNVYDAVIHVLETHGPMETAELLSHMEDIYPVSYARVIQALDHRSIGKLADGRAALIAQGASRTHDEEPKIPANGLWVENSEIYVHKFVDDDVFRGSGFILPRWLQWKFGLTATPEFVKFAPSANAEKNFVITRRGGQSFASSIKESLRANDIEKGCQVAIVLSPEKLTWRLVHNHDSCH